MRRKILVALIVITMVVIPRQDIYTVQHLGKSNVIVIWPEGTKLTGTGNESRQMGWANVTIDRNMTITGIWKGETPGVVEDMLVAPLVTIGNTTTP